MTGGNPACVHRGRVSRKERPRLGENRGLGSSRKDGFVLLTIRPSVAREVGIAGILAGVLAFVWPVITAQVLQRKMWRPLRSDFRHEMVEDHHLR